MDQGTIERWKHDSSLEFRELLTDENNVFLIRMNSKDVENTNEYFDKRFFNEDNAHIGIGFKEVFNSGSLEEVVRKFQESPETIKEMVEEKYTRVPKTRTAMNVGYINRFLNEMQVSDRVVLMLPKLPKVIHFGRVISEVEYDEDLDPVFPVVRRVDWIKLNVEFDEFDLENITGFGCVRKLNHNQKGALFHILNREKLMSREKDYIVKNCKNVILRGAPGTGKTHLAKRIAATVISDRQTDDITDVELVPEEQWEFVHFHPNYEYSDFLEYLDPQTGKVRDGAFKAFCIRAKNDENRNPYVFIIDEINRGELVDIFGELVYSIDPYYRGEAGKIATKYASLHGDGEEDFYVPENVYIIGTMNDVDESLYSFKCAMVRRFTYLEIDPKETQDVILEGLDEDLKQEAIARMDALNEAIMNTEGWGKRHCIGAAFFKNLEREGVGFDELWDWNIKPLLEKYALSLNNDKLLDNMKAVYDEAY